MSKKQWIVLLMLFLAYLLLGASIFYHIEGQLEIEHVELARQERIRINALLHEHYIPSRNHGQHEIFERLTNYCGKSVYNYTEGEKDNLKWDFYNSFYFAYTVVSTIGYGNLAPTNMLSRILMIFYGLIGIPMNGILLSQLGEFFSHVFIRAHRKYKSYKKHRDNYYPKKLTPLETRKAGLAAQIFMYLTPGFVMFIFFPAFLFSHYEGWSYDEAVYYAFVTLTTIGFGDYVAGQDNTKGTGFDFILYKTFLICWISFGLGYIVMIMTFIAQGMRSKKIIRIEHKLAMNLKHTQSKIWNEFNKEISYLRRVFNELQLSKVKRVYVDEFSYEIPPIKFSRCNSFPNLRKLNYGGLEVPVPLHPRRRANSEVVPMEPLIRVVSETDLQRIDKTATFATHAIVQPAELLAKLVNILGYIPPPEDANDSSDWEQEHKDEEETRRVCVDGFSEKEILAKENGTSTWIIGNDKIPSLAKPRSRAASEVRLYETKNEANIHQENGEWTWSDPAASRKIQELIKTRRSGLSIVKDSKLSSYKFPSISLPKSVPKNLFPPWRRQSKVPDVEQGNQKSTQIDSDLEVEPNYSSLTSKMEHFANLDDEIDTKRSYFTHTGGTEGSNLLEETSVADFLRAITVLHAKIGTVPTDYVHKPQRKMGTACLTPPRLPSLFTLFSQPSVGQDYSQSNQNTINTAQSTQYSRRFSLRPSEHQSGSSTPSYRRGSSIPSTKPRRFSLRPVTTLNGVPSEHNATHTSSRLRDDQTKLSFLTNSFLVESPKKPLVEMEGTPGISSPVATSSNMRRFSLKSAQSGVPTASQSMQTPKPVPRWKAGMLQRQIGRMSVRRRVRAFSLGDVQTDKTEKMSNLSPLATDGSIKTVSTGRPSVSSGQKTVTIVPPTKEDEVLQSTSAKDLFLETVMSTDNQNLLKGFKNVSPYDKFAFRSESLQEKSSCSDDQAKFLEKVPVNTNPFVTSTTVDQVNLKDVKSNDKIEGTFELFQDQRNDKGEKKEIPEFFTDITEIKVENNTSTELNLTSNTQQLELDNVPIELKAATEEDETKKIYSKKQKQSNFMSESSDKSTKGDENTFPTNTLMSVQSSADIAKDRKHSATSQSSRKSSTIKSEDKPRVSIDSYKLDLKIEKPSINPFLQYQASTSAPLTEVKVEKAGETVVHRKLSAEARKPWEKG